MNPFSAAGQADPQLTEVVLLTPNGTQLIGHYDGYGGIVLDGDSLYKIPSRDWAVGARIELVHQRCWEESERAGYQTPSPNAMGQGHFYDDGEEVEPGVTRAQKIRKFVQQKVAR
jgi:hypothetical protein